MRVGDVSDTGGFDVFLSHSSADKRSVEVVAERLVAAGIRPYLDRWHLVAGVPWQDELTRALAASGSVAVFVGPTGSGPWQHEELRLALDRAVASRDEFRVIPVLLPGADLGSVNGLLAQRTWVDFRSGLDSEMALERLGAGIRGEAYTDNRFVLPDDPSPYRGLLRFEADDARFYFGRDPDIERLVAMLRVESFVAVVGASGSGKSSLVRAGLLPHMHRFDPLGGRGRRVLVCVPGADPFRSLAEQVARLDPVGVSLGRVDELTDRFRGRNDGLITAIGGVSGGDGWSVLLVVDQFEELFTLGSGGRGRADAERLVANLAMAVADPQRRVKVVVTLRADFVATALNVDGLAGLLQARQVMLGTLTGDRLREAIVRPAEQVGAMFEKGLVATLMGDVDAEPGALPLLQHALFELWTRRRGPWLTIEAYEDSGRVVGALSLHAEAVYQRLPAPQQAAARAILIRLTTIGEGVPDTRRRASHGELYPTGINRTDVDAVLLALSGPDARLIVIDDGTVEVAHEALLRNWDRLRGWLDTDRDAIRVHRRLTQAALEWDRDLDHDPSALYAGARLVEATEFAECHGDALNDTERRFVDASAARAADELQAHRHRSRILRRRLVAATVAAVLALAGFGAAIVFLLHANNETERAEAQSAQSAALGLAAHSESLANENPALSMALAAEAIMATPTPRPESQRALLNAGVAFTSRTLQPVGAPLGDRTDASRGVAFSPDGTMLASTSGDGTVRLWDPATGVPIGDPLVGHKGAVWAAAFSPDGTMLASASGDGTVRLWDPATGVPIGDPLVGHTAAVLAVAFSPDGTSLASASDDQTVRLWDPATGDPIGDPLVGHTAAVLAVAFSPDGTTLASASDDQTVRLWDPATGDPIGDPLKGHTGAVWGVAFSPDGATLASASEDYEVRLWDSRFYFTPIGFHLHTGGLLGVAFSPDGTMLAAASDDGTVLLLDPNTSDPIGDPLNAHTGAVWGVAFSPDSKLLATASVDDGRVRLWDPNTSDPLAGHADAADGVAFSPDGSLLASASEDQTVRLWDPATGDPIGDPLAGHTDAVFGVAFSPDGSLLASASGDQTVRLWDPATGDPIGDPLAGHTDAVSGVAFSPDGSLLASASMDGSVRLWDPATGDPIGDPLAGHTDAVFGVAFSPDGSLLASASGDQTVRLWDPATGDPIGDPLAGHTDAVSGVAFSPDGSLLASASMDGSVRLWDPATGDPIGDPLDSGTDGIWSVAFSPVGKLLASASRDGTVQLWDPTTGGPRGDRLDSRADWVLAVAFSPDGNVLASAGSDGTVRLWDAVWDPDRACELAAPYVRRHQVEQYLPDGVEPRACVDLD